VLQGKWISDGIDGRTGKLLAYLLDYGDDVAHTSSSVQRSIANGASVLSRNQGTCKSSQGRKRRQGEGGELHGCEREAK
jgi:hypothetical protein